MNEETIKFLRELAEKLGTTVEHLWAVLVRQAPIESAVSLLQYAGIAVAVWVWFRLGKRLRANDLSDAEFRGVAWVLCGVVLATLSLVAFFSINSTITGFVNPEYWAFQKVKP